MQDLSGMPAFGPVRIEKVSRHPEDRLGGGGSSGSGGRNWLMQGESAARHWAPPQVDAVGLELDFRVMEVPTLARRLETPVRSALLPLRRPLMRPGVGPAKLQLSVQVQGWKFSAPVESALGASAAELGKKAFSAEEHLQAILQPRTEKPTRQKPPAEAVLLKERLLTLLQPPLENWFAGKQIELPFKPFQYQMEGIAFLMPRPGALLADEMGLGKTMQAIVSLRLLLQAGDVRRALIVCPKPLVPNWLNELKLWAPDVPVEVIGGEAVARKVAWTVSKSPVKLVNYELLTRDAELLTDAQTRFDLVILDEAQRIKNEVNKTAEVVRSIERNRSWALTGTPIENRPADLINIWKFVHPGELPSDTPVKELARLTRDSILRRVKEEVMKDMPPKLIRDFPLELAPAQREAYELAEKEGIVHLNDLGETITVQHVFELVMRLKQICNFDPRTGQSAKLDQLQADMAEVAESGRKAIIFSQWVEPLEILAGQLREFGPLLYHGKVPQRERQNVLQSFKEDPDKHVILMSYGTGSVGLNLQFSNYVFLFDRWWNPAVEDQAINRAHRIGQKSTVFVKRFVTQNTIECRICEVLEHKRQLFESIIAQNGPPLSMGLTEEEIFGLFRLKPKAKKGPATVSPNRISQGLEDRC
jgi:SNF2 family DNA or RNA helicase